ncbi:hypothetical protein CBA19CS42_09495 [Caballeronia novacaledonica]|uniref:Uncharacterized protein n=1 Tax=Caballeronia novacaledonica TaxID=1544861 RepID=A0AA37I7X3_9BURK|nr:hypothetical protein CBA19CS42_09495 [Caballeronia novacaledonica]
MYTPSGVSSAARDGAVPVDGGDISIDDQLPLRLRFRRADRRPHVYGQRGFIGRGRAVPDRAGERGRGGRRFFLRTRICIRFAIDGGIRRHAPHARREQDHVPAAEEEAERDAIGDRSRVVIGIRLIEKDCDGDFEHAACHREAPFSKADHASGDDLQGAIDEKERAEDERQHEVAVLAAEQHEQRRQAERRAFHITQLALAAHAGPCDGERGEALEQHHQREGHDGKVERTVERIGEDDAAERDAEQPERQHRAPSRAQIVDAEENHHEPNHRFLRLIIRCLVRDMRSHTLYKALTAKAARTGKPQTNARGRRAGTRQPRAVTSFTAPHASRLLRSPPRPAAASIRTRNGSHPG